MTSTVSSSVSSESTNSTITHVLDGTLVRRLSKHGSTRTHLLYRFSPTSTICFVWHSWQHEVDNYSHPRWDTTRTIQWLDGRESMNSMLTHRLDGIRREDMLIRRPRKREFDVTHVLDVKWQARYDVRRLSKHDFDDHSRATWKEWAGYSREAAVKVYIWRSFTFFMGYEKKYTIVRHP